jgi:hypothetical protein
MFIDFPNFQTVTALDSNNPNYGNLRHISDLLTNTYSKYYAPSEHLTADNVLFKEGRS